MTLSDGAQKALYVAMMCAGVGLVGLKQKHHKEKKKNFSLILTKYPLPNDPVRDSDFEYVECGDPTSVSDCNNSIVIETLYLSVDPYMRCRFNEETNAEYLTPFVLGEPPVGGGIGRVLASSCPDFQPGDIVESMFAFPWQLYSMIPITADGPVRKIVTPKIQSTVSLSAYLGPLGIPGLSAYFCLLAQGKPVAGETVVISGCAGATGSVAGQIAKLKGCRVVGICGSAAKAQVCVERLGFDVALNYRDADWAEQLKAACPHKVDIYFDNVGGMISDTVAELMNQGGRIPVCGQIADYNKAVPRRTSSTGSEGQEEEEYIYPPRLSPRLEGLLESRSVVRGRFLVLWYAEKFPDALNEIRSWLESGQLHFLQTTTEGLAQAGHAFTSMMEGGNVGKAVVKVV